jgi:mannose-6-phosphate isomerase-like protein (cupin superfamily)
MRTNRRIVLGVVGGIVIVALVSISVWAQAGAQRTPPAGDSRQAFLLPAATVLATAAKLPRDRGNASDVYLERTDSVFPGTKLAYRIGMERRLPNLPHNAAIHETEAELWGVIDGALTITTGGTLVSPRQNGTNWSANAIQGGAPIRVGKGDFLMIPEGVAHQVTGVEGEATLVTFEVPRPRAAAQR